MSSHPDLPPTYRALVVTSTSSPPTDQTLPTPQPGPGNVIVCILAADVISYMRDIYDGTRHHPFPSPLTAGTSAIGRIAATGPDATSLTPDNLIHINCTIRGRDDFLNGIMEGYSAGSRKLMSGEWRDSTYAEHAKVPLENYDRLGEEGLTGSGGAGV